MKFLIGNKPYSGILSFFLNDQKKETKKSASADVRPEYSGINCRKFIRIGGKNFNSPVVRKALTFGTVKNEVIHFKSSCYDLN